MKKLLVWLLCVVLIATNISSLVYAEPVTQNITANGWVNNNGRVSYYENGQLVTGWFTDYCSNLTYFFNTTAGSDYGILVKGWQIIDNKQCYFNPYSFGELLVATVTPDGSIVNENGVKIDESGNEIFASGGMSSNGSKKNISPNDKSKDNLLKTFEMLTQLISIAIATTTNEEEKKNQTSLLNFFQILSNSLKRDIQKRDASQLNDKSNNEVGNPLIVDITEQTINARD